MGEVDWEMARQTHHTKIAGEHEWDTIADRRPGLYGRLLEPPRDRLHPPRADQYSGDVGVGRRPRGGNVRRGRNVRSRYGAISPRWPT